jgi:uncharacterized protein (TIGR00251 family)
VPDAFELTAVPGGTRLRLRVRPGAKTTAVVGAHGGALKIAVAAPPERGKANRAVVKLLAETFGLPATAVTITAGETSQDKVAVVGLGVARLRDILDAHVRTPKR